MDYRQARAFIEDTNKYGSILGLANIRNLMGHLGNVQEQLQIIHVAGTNGKGSVCALISGILREAGYRIGVYTSPAVFDDTEIFQIDGVQIPQEAFAELTSDVQAACVQMQKEGLPHPTAFEVETAIAFCYFKREKCDFVVLETGLGGVSDATNLITHPVCSVLASISRDHTAWLGEALAQIAAAKAGIIKPGCPCVTAAQEPEVLAVIRKKAAEMGSELWIADDKFIRNYEYDGQGSRFELAEYDVQGSRFAQAEKDKQESQFERSEDDGQNVRRQKACCGLTGACQRKNIACALAVIRLLQKRGVFIPRDAVLKGLSKAHMPGRFERIHEKPDFYIDGAHNEGAALFLKETVQNCFTNRRIIYIIGVFKDKEYEKLLQVMLPYAAEVFTVTPNHPRALDGRKLAETAKRYYTAAAVLTANAAETAGGAVSPANAAGASGAAVSVSYVPKIADAAALAAAAAAAGAEGVVLAFGSFSYLGELRQAVKDRL